MKYLLAPKKQSTHNGYFDAVRIVRLLLILLLLIFPILSAATPAKADTPPFVPDGTTNIIYLPVVTTGSSGGGELYRPSRFVPKYDLMIEEDGIYRITYEDLLDAGQDLLNVKANDLAVTNRGQAIPIYVHSNRKFGPGSYIEFYGEAVNSIYTHTNVYTLFADRNYALRVAEDDLSPDSGVPVALSYWRTVNVNRDRHYAFNAPGDDPWFDTNMITHNTPKTWEYPVEIKNFDSTSTTATLSLSLWGAVEINNTNPDHHYQVSINGTLLGDKNFDGWVVEQQTFDIPPGVLHEGENTLQITLPGDTGGYWDAINLDKYSLTYASTFNAIDDSITFSSDGVSFEVSGFSTGEIIAYRKNGNTLTRYTNLDIHSHGNIFSAAFPGENNETFYYVYAAPALLSPSAIEQQPKLEDIDSGNAELLIISHPDFIDSLAPLVQARQSEGYTVQIVNVEDIYYQYNYGIVNPKAIKDYIRFAVSNKGTRYVLLVGSDTYDYFNNLGLDAKSFIPSHYAKTDQITTFAPVDPWYVDLDDDNVPNLAIGRFPVRTKTELDILINKTLAYANKDYNETSSFSADKYFSKFSDSFIAKMPESWAKNKVYLDEMELSEARANLVASMNSGVALVSYVGHASDQEWSYYDLFTIADAETLANVDKPFVTTEYGCMSSYFIDPTYESLSHELLVGGNRGAAATIGSTTVGYAGSQSDFGNKLTPELVKPGQTIGDAVLYAKKLLHNTYPFYIEIYLGYTIFGDPTLVIQP